MQIIRAGDSKVTSLYHYMLLKADWLENLLRDGIVRFSDPRSFNDPWDCRPCFDIRVLDDERMFQEYLRWFNMQHVPEIDEHPVAKRNPKLLRQLKYNLLLKSIDDMGRRFESLLERYRVYCMSAVNTSILMWSHYAENHTGICLEFDATKLPLSAAIKVEYCESYPSLTLSNEGESLANLLPLAVKAAAWKYESEYRLLSIEKGYTSAEGMHVSKDGFFKFPRDALKSIIIGCECKSEAVILQLRNKLAPDVAIQRAQRVRNMYLLVIDRLE